jgi:hypothetical protein
VGDVHDDRKLIITWPLAVCLMFVSGCVTLLALANYFPRELVSGWIGLIIGAAIPTQPLATRFRTVYSEYPPPRVVESDRPEPNKPEGSNPS